MVINIPTGYEYLRLKESSKPFHQLNFKWRSQRQVRKNQRRQWANGNKRAFS